MKYVFYFYTSCCIVIVLATMQVVAPAFAQSSSSTIVRGRVQDKQTGIFLPGTIVSLIPTEEAKVNDFLYAFQGARASLNLLAGESASGQRTGAIVRRDGTFEIKNVKPGKYVMTTRYIGYKKITQTIDLEINKPLDFAQELIPDVQGLESIVVTGVASRNAKGIAELGIGRIDAQILTDNNQYSDPLQMLIAKVPNLFMQFSNGNLATGVRINIRSSASLLGGQPTIFIDGVRSTGVDYQNYEALQYDEVSPLSTLAPNDIETIEILKGPAASALYGTSGQNGVVLITTKRGKVSPAHFADTSSNNTNSEAAFNPNYLRVNYRFTGGLQEPHRLYSPDYTLNAANVNRIFRIGQMAQHNVSVQGGIGSAVNFFATFTNRSEMGILPGSDLSQNSVRFNLDIEPIPGFLAKFSASLSKNFFNIPVQNENGGIFVGWIANTLGGDPYSGKRFFMTDSAYIANTQNNIDVTHFLGSADISYAPLWLPGLRLRVLAATEEIKSRAVLYNPPDPNATPYGGYRFIKDFIPSRVNYDANISYNTDIMDGLNATFITGVQAYDNRFLFDYFAASNFRAPGIRSVQTANSSFVAELDERYREAGVFARVETNYKQTLFMSAGLRNEYSSTLGVRAPSIFYPQASFALRLDKLGILPAEWNFVKLRGAYGESGKLPKQRESSILWKLFSGPGTSLTNWTGTQLFYETPIGNDSINPERIQDIELGADIEVNDRFGAELTGFYQFSRDAILQGSFAPSTGFGTTTQNIGRMRSWGAEAQIYGQVVNTSDVSLRVNLLGGFADNTVDSLGPNNVSLSERSLYAGAGLLAASNYIIKGQRRGVFMDRPPLTPRYTPSGYYDWDRGPILDSVQRAIGSSVPLLTGSFSWMLTFLRDFTFTGLIDAGFGRSIFNGTLKQISTTGGNPRFNRLVTQLGMAKGQVADNGLGIRPVDDVQPLQPNTDEYRAAAIQMMNLDPRYGTLTNYTEKADWVRLRELSFRWNARASLATLLPEVVRTLFIGISLRNAFLWTTYSGLETEINSPANIPSRSIAQSSDIYTVMQARVLNFSIELGF